MPFNTRVDLMGWRDGVVRPRLDGLYREARFRVISEGIPAFDVCIFVHPAWPEAEAEKVARSFLAARLAEVGAAVDAYTPAELDDLWSACRPAG